MLVEISLYSYSLSHTIGTLEGETKIIKNPVKCVDDSTYLVKTILYPYIMYVFYCLCTLFLVDILKAAKPNPISSLASSHHNNWLPALCKDIIISYVIVLWCINTQTELNLPTSHLSDSALQFTHNITAASVSPGTSWSDLKVQKWYSEQAKELILIEVSTARMTWALFSGRFSNSELYIPFSLRHPCRSVQKRGGPGPSNSPRRGPRCKDARQRSMAWRGDHQLRIRISNPILLQQTVWTNIDEGVPVVKETSGGSVAHASSSQFKFGGSTYYYT